MVLKKHENTTNIFFCSINNKHMAAIKPKYLSGAVEENFSCNLKFLEMNTSAEYSSVPNNSDWPVKSPSDQLDFINFHQYITKHYGHHQRIFCSFSSLIHTTFPALLSVKE